MIDAVPAIEIRTTAAVEAANLATVRDAFARWESGTGSVFDLRAPDMRWTIVGSGPSAGTYDRAALDRLLAPFNANLATPLRPRLGLIVAQGDIVIVRFSASGAIRGGGTYRNDYAWFLTLRGGRIAAVTAFLDLPAFDAVRRGRAAGPRRRAGRAAGIVD